MSAFSQIHIQLVFAVKNRNAIISNLWEERLFKYVTSIVADHGQKLLAINGMPDHIHIFLGIRPDCRLSDLVRDIKKSSNAFINDNRFSKFHFEWQEGYGAFSYGYSQIDKVVKYINSQKEHHIKRSFKAEYLALLEKFNIIYDAKYMPTWLEENESK